MRRILLTEPVGGAAGTVSLPAAISIDEGTGTGRPAASIAFDNDGQYVRSDDGTGTYNWFSPNSPGAGSPYEIRYAVTSGSVSTGTVSTWLAFPQTWTLTRVIPGISTVEGTLEIRLAAGGAIQATGTLNMTYEVI